MGAALTGEALKSSKVLEQLSRQAIEPSGAAGAKLDARMERMRTLALQGSRHGEGSFPALSRPSQKSSPECNLTSRSRPMCGRDLSKTTVSLERTCPTHRLRALCSVRLRSPKDFRWPQGCAPEIGSLSPDFCRAIWAMRSVPDRASRHGCDRLNRSGPRRMIFCAPLVRISAVSFAAISSSRTGARCRSSIRPDAPPADRISRRAHPFCSRGR